MDLSDFTLCTITQGLRLGILLNAKILSSIDRKGINLLSDVLPKGNQLYPVFLTTEKPVLDRDCITML